MLDTIQVKALPWLVTSHHVHTWCHPTRSLLKKHDLYTQSMKLVTGFLLDLYFSCTLSLPLSVCFLLIMHNQVNTHNLSDMNFYHFILCIMASESFLLFVRRLPIISWNVSHGCLVQCLVLSCSFSTFSLLIT